MARCQSFSPGCLIDTTTAVDLTGYGLVVCCAPCAAVMGETAVAMSPPVVLADGTTMLHAVCAIPYGPQRVGARLASNAEHANTCTGCGQSLTALADDSVSWQRVALTLQLAQANVKVDADQSVVDDLTAQLAAANPLDTTLVATLTSELSTANTTLSTDTSTRDGIAAELAALP